MDNAEQSEWQYVTTTHYPGIIMNDGTILSIDYAVATGEHVHILRPDTRPDMLWPVYEQTEDGKTYTFATREVSNGAWVFFMKR